MLNTLREKLKRYFIKGAMPTQVHFAELIDSMFIQHDDGISTQSSQGVQRLVFHLQENHQDDAVFQQSVNIKGNLIVEGQLLVAPLSDISYQQNTEIKLENHQVTEGVDTGSSALPNGSILLYCGNHIPDGFLPCDGTEGTPVLDPLTDNSALSVRYIIKVT